MFLADFSTTSIDEKKKKTGLLGTAKNIVIGKTIPGTLTRVGSVATVGGGLMMGSKLNMPKSNYILAQKIKNSKLAKHANKIAIGGSTLVGAAGVAGMAKNEYDKRNRKWWEIL